MKDVLTTRRTIIKTAAAGSVIGLTGTGFGAAVSTTAKQSKPGFNLGIASYTFRKFGLTETLDFTEILGLKYVSLKAMHLPLDSSQEQIHAVANQVKSLGLTLYGCGVIYMKSQEQVSKAFEYAKAGGMKTIIGVPSHDLLELVDTKVKEYDIMVAIHNHGPSDKIYPDPKSIYERVKGLDSRIGICMDIGHTQRCGQDPSEEAIKYADRLHDVHLKDVNKATAEGSTVEVGRGVIDIPKFIKTLSQIKYKGIAAFEFEKDGEAPMVGLAESVGYVKGVMSVL